jgi:hypothetical protein
MLTHPLLIFVANTYIGEQTHGLLFKLVHRLLQIKEINKTGCHLGELSL